MDLVVGRTHMACINPVATCESCDYSRSSYSIFPAGVAHNLAILDVVEAEEASRGTAAGSNGEAEVCVVCSKLGISTQVID